MRTEPSDLYWGKISEAEARNALFFLREEECAIPNLISRESLVGIDPFSWQRDADRNLRLFGPNTTILITLRSPISYMRSLYQQKIHEGNVLQPQDFFLSEDQHERKRGHSRSDAGEIFNVDLFSFSRLFSIYSDLFERVFVLPSESMENTQMWKDVFKINREEVIEKVIYSTRTSKPMNTAYSSLAMEMTFCRENILKNFGVKSRGSNDIGLYGSWKENVSKSTLPLTQKKLWKSLSWQEKLAAFPRRLGRKMANRLSKIFIWRRLMQELVSRHLPSKNYSLPEGLYLGCHIEENTRIHQSILQNGNGYIYLPVEYNGSSHLEDKCH